MIKGSVIWCDSYIKSTDQTKTWDFNNQTTLTHYVLKCLLGHVDLSKANNINDVNMRCWNFELYTSFMQLLFNGSPGGPQKNYGHLLNDVGPPAVVLCCGLQNFSWGRKVVSGPKGLNMNSDLQHNPTVNPRISLHSTKWPHSCPL